jgi:hypothetical protein
MNHPVAIDLLGFTGNSLLNLEHIARDVCETVVEDDGVRFDAENIRAERIKEDADYDATSSSLSQATRMRRGRRIYETDKFQAKINRIRY